MSAATKVFLLGSSKSRDNNIFYSASRKVPGGGCPRQRRRDKSLLERGGTMLACPCTRDVPLGTVGPRYRRSAGRRYRRLEGRILCRVLQAQQSAAADPPTPHRHVRP